MTKGLSALATFDLLRQYGACFGAAWRRRRQWEAVRRSRFEAEFLPAALALQETPVSPAPRITAWVIMAIAAVAAVWATLGEVDVVASAPGRVVSNDGSKMIQSLEAGTIRAIHVADGQLVRAGDVLIELDPTNARADRERLLSERAMARLTAARARALLTALDTGRPPVIERAGSGDEAQVQQAEQLLRGQYQQHLAQQANLRAVLAQRDAELRSTFEAIGTLEQQSVLARRRASDLRELAASHVAPEHGYLEQEQQRISSDGELALQRSRLSELDAAIQVTRAQGQALAADARLAALQALDDAEQRGRALDQELIKAQARSQSMQLTSPVDGTVQQLALRTVGGVVSAAQPLMIIVPSHDPVEVEASIENRDIGFVGPGRSAEVKVETFSYTKYGTVGARIISVSQDAIADEKRGLVYSARVALDRDHVEVDGNPLALTPGMAVMVEIKTGRRRVIEFLTSPILRYSRESFRER